MVASLTRSTTATGASAGFSRCCSCIDPATTWESAVSIEKEIERTKETYYEALAASSQGWREGKGDYAHFVTYMLGIIDACYRELTDRLSLAGAPSGDEGAVRAFFDRLIGSATKREIMDAKPWNQPGARWSASSQNCSRKV